LKVCTRCGSQNDDSLKYCTNCNSVLPNIPAASHAPAVPDVVMERYNQLKEAGDMVVNG